MKVKELRGWLANIPDDYDVILSSDAEGNKYSPLSSYEFGKCFDISSWEKEVWFKENWEEEYDDEFKSNCICLFPIN